MPLEIFFKFLQKTSVKAKFRLRGRKGLPSALPATEEQCRQFSLAELEAATNNFHHDLLIGQGSFGPVYKGFIDGGSLVVAVKRLSRSSAQGVEEFQTEVQLLCQLRHQNLVSLLGYCYEKDERILVYEHMTHGGLVDHLYGDVAIPLPWKQRLEICTGAARGLHYLHIGAKYAIIHHDVKASNILLDKDWAAKISDFGLSKIGPPSMSKPKANATKTELVIVGTYGYMAPEYMMKGELSEKCDVYALGVVLFEVLCGKAFDPSTSEEYIVSWIIKRIKDDCVHDIIDPFLKGKIAPLCLIEFIEIALGCIHPKASERPTMGEVEVKLELALELQEKADSVMKGVNSHAGYAYEDVSFSVSVRDYDRSCYDPDNSSKAWVAELFSDAASVSVAESEIYRDGFEFEKGRDFV